MRRFLSVFLILIAVIMIVGLAGCGTEDAVNDDDPLKEIVITEPVKGALWGPIYVAQTLGFFEEAGITVDFQTVSGGDPAAPVFAGDAQFGLRGVEMPMMATEAGQDVKILVSTSRRFPYAFIGQAPNFTTVESLRGEVAAGNTPSGSPTAWVKACLAYYGLEPDKDVDITMVAHAGVISAMTSGDIAATSGSTGSNIQMLLENGGEILVDGRDTSFFKEMMGSETYEMYIMFATDKYIADNPETVQKVITAVAKGIQWINEHTAEEVTEALAPLFQDKDKLLIDVEEAKQYEQFTVDGKHTVSGYQAALKLAKTVGAISDDIPAERIYDETFLDKAWEELKK